MDELESNELEAARLKAGDDVSNEPALDTVGLYNTKWTIALRSVFVYDAMEQWAKRKSTNLDHDVGAFLDRHI